MKTSHKSVVMICNHKEFFRKIRYYLDEFDEILEKKSVKSLHHLLRLQSVSCILLYIEEESVLEEIYLYKLKKNFPLVPLLAITNHNSLELARKCGQIGIDKVIPVSEMEHLKSAITELCSQSKIKVTFKNLGLKLQGEAYSDILRETLEIIENNYITLTSVNDIAALIEVSECTLSREFQKYQLPGPKRILMYLKVYHASLLMQNKGLNIREIALQSGFCSDKRMAECFQRVYNMSPGKYRMQINENKINTSKKNNNPVLEDEELKHVSLQS